jgi:predicted GIY-YIG superfamily endonuclease
MEKPYYCYILYSSNPYYSNLTYNGSTNNIFRRFRQHNGEICGGAKATSGKGKWLPLAILEGCKTHKEALSCEWRIKHPTGSRIRPKKYCGKKGRIDSLNIVLSLDKWTSNSSGLETGNEYKLYIINELIQLIDKEKIKQNITIKSMDEFSYI